MNTSVPQAPAVVRAGSLPDSIKVEPLTCAIGAQLSNVDLGVASRDPGLVAEIRALLLKHRVLFLRDQDITRAEHVAFARHFGELEDHPVAGSDPDHPELPWPVLGACNLGTAGPRRSPSPMPRLPR